MPEGAHCLTVRPSAWVSVGLPRLDRFIFCERLIRPWRLLPGPARTLPVAVILNRFLTDDLVFNLGILVSFWFTLTHPARMNRRAVAAGHALPGPVSQTAARYSDAGDARQARTADRAARTRRNQDRPQSGPKA